MWGLFRYWAGSYNRGVVRRGMGCSQVPVTPLSELELFQLVKFIVKDAVIVTGRKMNRKLKYIMMNAGNSFLSPLEFKVFL